MRVSNCRRVNEEEIVIKVNGYYTTLTRVGPTDRKIYFDICCGTVAFCFVVYLLLGMWYVKHDKENVPW